MRSYLFILGVMLLPPSAPAQEALPPRITSATIQEGSFDTAAVDVQQDSCGTGEDISREPYFDTTIKLVIKNPGQSTLKLRRLQFRLLGGIGRAPLSRPIGFIGTVEVPARSTTTVSSLLLTARDSGKFVPGQSSRLEAVGFRNVVVTVTARAGSGKTIKLRARTVLSLNNYSRCDVSG